MDTQLLIILGGTIGFLVITPMLLKEIYQKEPKRTTERRITLKRDKMLDLSASKPIRKFLSEFMERVVFAKWTSFGYWDSVNANLRFFAATWVSCFITGFLYIAFLDKGDTLSAALNIYNSNIDPKHAPALLKIFGATFIAYYWNDRTSYYNKWKYLAELYNDCLKAEPFIPFNADKSGKNNFSYRNSLEHALAIDIIEMEMWSHNSFREFVFELLKEAIKHDSSRLKFRDDSDYLNHISKMTKRDAMELLGKYQSGYLRLEEDTFQLHLVA